MNHFVLGSRPGIRSKILPILVVTLVAWNFSQPGFAAKESKSEDTSQEVNIEEVKTQDIKQKDKKFKDPIEAEPVELERSMAMAASSSGEGAGIQVLSAPQNLNVDPKTGTVTTNIPIVVPAGRGGIQPNIAPTYNSSIKNGILGVGWSLDLGSIQRSTKKGAPKYTDADTFLMNSAGAGGELVFDDAVGYYRTKIEDGFSKTVKDGNTWVVKDKSGVTYSFGTSTNSRQSHPSFPNDAFVWYLDRVEDVHGNFMTLTYSHDNGQVYPSSIIYTDHADLSAHAEVNFELDASRYASHTSHIAGFPIKTTKRTNKIVVKADGVIQREYEFVYSQSPVTQKDLITRVIQHGKEGSGEQLPDITFQYAQDKGFDLASGWNVPTNMPFSEIDPWNTITDLGVRMVDLNADSYTDMVQCYKASYHDGLVSKVYINNQNNGWDLTADDWQACNEVGEFIVRQPQFYSGNILIKPNNVDRGGRFVDLDGDGYVDLIQNRIIWRDYASQKIPTNTAFLNNQSNGWGADAVVWHNPDSNESGPIINPTFAVYNREFIHTYPAYSLFLGILFTDVNGDGYTDLVRAQWPDTTAGYIYRTYINNKVNDSDGWVQDDSWKLPYSPYTAFSVDEEYGRRAARFVDLNGDNLPDIYYNNSSTIKVYMNTGRNWVEDTGSSWLNSYGFGNTKDGSTQFADINGDGLPDMIVAKGSYANGSRILINTGNGWYEDSSLAQTDANFQNGGTNIIDADGNGMVDFLVSFNNEIPKLYLNDGRPADLLVAVNNNTGGTTTIGYGYAAQFTNDFLPFTFPVVTSITKSDMRTSDSYTTTYVYSGGLWDRDEREFRGFSAVTVRDAEGNYVKTEYLQDDIYKGRVLRQGSYDVSGNLFGKVENTWNSEEIYPESNFVYLERKDSFVYDGDATGRRTAEEFFYKEAEQLGNLTKAVQLGEVDFETGDDILSDKRIIETAYVNNTSGENWLIGLPRETVVKDNAGSTIRKTWFYYDNPDNTTPPVKGLLTKKEDWAGDASEDVNPVTRYTYDNTGNLLSTIDPLNNTTNITYDTDYNIFPLTTMNALGHSVVNEYYGVNGVLLDSGDGYAGLWGQLKSTTDPNNQTGKRSYNTLGDLVVTVSPLDTIDFPTQTTDIEFFSDHIKVTTHQRINHGQSETVKAVAYVDGMGRTIQTKTVSGNAGQYIVSGQVEYDSRGLPEKKYLNRFTSNGLDMIDSIDPGTPHVTLTYDAMGRTIQATSPDGTYSSAFYNDWTTEAINENGHKQASDFDAYGRLVEKREYRGADGRSVHYPVFAYTLYATTRYFYDSEGNLIQTQDTHGNVTSIVYDHLGRKISMNDPDMGEWFYEYDLNGNLVKQTDAKDQVIDFTYDALNRLVNKTDGGSLNVSYTYDDPFVDHSKGRLTQAQYSGGDTDFEYDEIGREIQSIKMINSQNFNVQRNYDAINELLDVQYPDGEKIYYKYNPAGQIEAISNDESLIGPQSFNRSFSEEREASFVENFVSAIQELNPFYVKEAHAQTVDDIIIDNTQAETDGYWGASTSKSGYYPPNYAYNQTGSGADKMRWRPDIIVSGIYKVSYWLPNGIRYSPDDAQYTVYYKDGGQEMHLVNQELPGGEWKELGEYEFDTGTDGYVELTDENEGDYTFADAIKFEYVGGGTPVLPTVNLSAEPEIITEGESATLSWTSTDADSCTASDGWSGTKAISGNEIVSPVSTTTYTLTCSGPGGVSDPSSVTVTVNPPAGVDDIIIDNTQAETDGYWGASTSKSGYYPPNYAYNQTGSGADKMRWRPNIIEPGIYKVFYWLPNGIRYSPDDAQYTVYYKDGGQEVHLVNQELPGGQWKELGEYEFDSGTDGYVELTDENEGDYTFADAVKFEYVGAGGPEPNENATLFVSNVVYNAQGQMTQIEYGNGTITTNTYAPLTLRLTRIHTVDAQRAVLQDLNYTYDSVGNILSITDNVNSADQTFVYDELNRLVEAQAPQTYGTKSYQYDEIGNIISKDALLYTYGEGGAGPHAVTSRTDGTTFTYDANGNMATKQTPDLELTEYTYDAENRLTEVVRGGFSIAQYTYDGDGGRVTKTTGGVTTKFIGSLYELNPTRSTRYVFFGGMRVASITNGEVLYYLGDHLGGINVLTGTDGAVKEIIEYKPFGAYARQDKYGTDDEVARYYFTGQRKDDETGLYFYNARYYDPDLGRFITADTLIPGFSNPQSLNRYSYALNNPVNRIDPSGHWSWKKFWKAAVGAIVGVASAVLLGPAGFAVTGATMAGAIGGAAGGAITGGLNGGWKGALTGAALGGALGGIGGWGVSNYGWQFGAGMFIVGAGVAGATNSWDSFAGGIAGGTAGWILGNGIASYHLDPLSQTSPEGGVRNNKVEGRGVGTTPAKALKVANETGSVVLYTQSRNTASDIIRGAMQLVFKNSLASRQFAQYISAHPGMNYNLHSEMTLTALGAMGTIQSQGGKTPGHFRLVSPFYSEATANSSFGAVGSTVDYVPPHLADPAGMFATFTPVTAPIYGPLSIVTFEHFHGYETYSQQGASK